MNPRLIITLHKHIHSFEVFVNMKGVNVSYNACAPLVAITYKNTVLISARKFNRMIRIAEVVKSAVLLIELVCVLKAAIIIFPLRSVQRVYNLLNIFKL